MDNILGDENVNILFINVILSYPTNIVYIYAYRI